MDGFWSALVHLWRGEKQTDDAKLLAQADSILAKAQTHRISADLIMYARKAKADAESRLRDAARREAEAAAALAARAAIRPQGPQEARHWAMWWRKNKAPPAKPTPLAKVYPPMPWEM